MCQIVDINRIFIPDNLTLSDHITNPLKLISCFQQVVVPEVVRLGSELPVLQNTKLGWPLCGSTPVVSFQNGIVRSSSFSNNAINDATTNLLCHSEGTNFAELILSNIKFLSTGDK